MRLLACLALATLTSIPSQDSPVERIDDLLGGLDAILAPLDRHPGGVKGEAERLKGDPARVRDVLETLEFEPYLGVMKGPEATLATGAGNSFDQAILAAALMSPFRKVRFAVGEVTEARVRELFARPPRREPRPVREALPEEHRRNSESITRTIQGQIDEHVRTLDDLLKAKGVALQSASSIALGRTWCWLEYEHAGEWRALTEPPGEAKERFEAVPERLQHRLELTVRLERQEGNELHGEEIMKVAYPASAFFGHALRFQILPAPGEPDSIGRMTQGNRVGVDPYLSYKDLKRFVPAVILGNGAQYGKAFDLEGRTFAIDAAAGFKLQGTEALGGRVGALLGRKPPEGKLTGVWWAVRRMSPGLPDQSWEREIVDLLGFGNRPGKLGEQDRRRILFAFLGFRELELDFGPWTLGNALLRWRRGAEALRGFARSLAAYRDKKQSLEATLRSLRVSSQDMNVFMLYRSALREELERRFGSRSYQPAPGIVAQHREYIPGEKDAVRLRVTFDVVDLPSTIEGPRSAAFRLAMGVGDTEMELAACDCKAERFNTASLVRKAKAPLKCLTRPEEADGLRFKPTARARVKTELQAGMVVAAPEDEIDGQAVWWRIDPKSGQTLGIGETGCGQTATEYWTILKEKIDDYFSIAEILYCYLMAIMPNPWAENHINPFSDPAGVMKNLADCVPACTALGKAFNMPFKPPKEDGAFEQMTGIKVQDQFYPNYCKKAEAFAKGLLD